MPINQTLRQLIDESPYTVTEVANKAGVAYTTLHYWLTGRSATPKDAPLKRVADVLGIDPAEINPLFGYCGAGKHKNPDWVIHGGKKACRECKTETTRRIRAGNPGIDRQYNQRTKAEVIARYGGRCVCCGETNIGFLTIDHINNDGYLEPTAHLNPTNNIGSRRRATGNQIYRRLRVLSEIRKDLQVMCWNCNCGRAANGGVCPHESGVFL